MSGRKKNGRIINIWLAFVECSLINRDLLRIFEIIKHYLRGEKIVSGLLKPAI